MAKAQKRGAKEALKPKKPQPPKLNASQLSTKGAASLGQPNPGSK